MHSQVRETSIAGMELTDRDRAILDFERSWWAEAGPKEALIREKFELSATRYYQVFRCVAHRLGAARHTQAGGRAAGAHHSPAAQVLINARIRRLTGIALAV